jgi:hypothetical protein
LVFIEQVAKDIASIPEVARHHGLIDGDRQFCSQKRTHFTLQTNVRVSLVDHVLDRDGVTTSISTFGVYLRIHMLLVGGSLNTFQSFVLGARILGGTPFQLFTPFSLILGVGLLLIDCSDK